MPIERLPDEVLAEVFSWCILGVCNAAHRRSQPALDDLSEFLTDTAKTSPAPYSWLTIRHVCRASREIALTFPELSMHIFLTRPKCVQDMLSRSGTLPLHIYDPSAWFMNLHRNWIIAPSKLVLNHLEPISHGCLIFVYSISDDRNMADTVIDALRSPGFRTILPDLIFLPVSGWIKPRIFDDFECPTELRHLSCRYANVHIHALRNMITRALQLRTLKLVQSQLTSLTGMITLL